MVRQVGHTVQQCLERRAARMRHCEVAAASHVAPLPMDAVDSYQAMDKSGSVALHQLRPPQQKLCEVCRVCCVSRCRLSCCRGQRRHRNERSWRDGAATPCVEGEEHCERDARIPPGPRVRRPKAKLL
eukprot:1893503-Prymnesium_polylepis.2